MGVNFSFSLLFFFLFFSVSLIQSSKAAKCYNTVSFKECKSGARDILKVAKKQCKKTTRKGYERKLCRNSVKASYKAELATCAEYCTEEWNNNYNATTFDSLDLSPCKYCTQGSGCPADWLPQTCFGKGGPVQQDSGGSDQLRTRCGNKCPTPSCIERNNQLACIINSNSGGYDYNNKAYTDACPYPACDQTKCLANAQEWWNFGQGSTVQFNIGSSANPVMVPAMRAIGHGVQSGERGTIAVVKGLDLQNVVKYVLVFQMDIRSWSFEFTQDAQTYLTGLDGPNIGGTCIIPEVAQITVEEARARGAYTA